MTQRYFAVTTPGFERQVADEVDAIGGRKIVKPTGGAEFDATHRTFYRTNYEVRTANRIYLRVDEFRARDAPELYNKVRRYGWERLLGADNAVYIKGVAHQSRLMHTGKIAESAGHALREHFEEDLGTAAPAIVAERDEADQLLLVRLDDDRCQLSLDASGELMFKRGWRHRAVEAPMRESLAAALLARAGWDGQCPLVDPVCGSGTFAIEAAWMAAKRPPGELREFAFQKWANFRPELWDDVVEQAAQRVEPAAEIRCWGLDTDPAAIDVARSNADIAGVSQACDFRQADIAEFKPPCDQPGLVIANPPYGRRMEAGRGPRQVWETLVKRFARHFDGWRMAIVLPADLEPSHDGLTFTDELGFQNGGVNVRFWLVEHV